MYGGEHSNWLQKPMRIVFAAAIARPTVKGAATAAGSPPFNSMRRARGIGSGSRCSAENGTVQQLTGVRPPVKRGTNPMIEESRTEDTHAVGFAGNGYYRLIGPVDDMTKMNTQAS